MINIYRLIIHYYHFVQLKRSAWKSELRYTSDLKGIVGKTLIAYTICFTLSSLFYYKVLGGEEIGFSLWEFYFKMLPTSLLSLDYTQINSYSIVLLILLFNTVNVFPIIRFFIDRRKVRTKD